MVDEIDMETVVEMMDNSVFCAIKTDMDNCQFAFYVDINGEGREQRWYTEDSSYKHEFGEQIVYFVVVTSFLKDEQGNIHSQVIRKKTNWAICEGVLLAAKLLTNKTSTILEFGSGVGSQELAQHCEIYSIEHNEKFVNAFPDVNYIHAPLSKSNNIVDFREDIWYDSDLILESLPGSIDLVLVDGPPSSIGRSGLLSHLDWFNDSVYWIIDDVLRGKDQKLANYICLKFSLIQYRFWNFSILSKSPLDFEILKLINDASLMVLTQHSDKYLQQFYPSLNSL